MDQQKLSISIDLKKYRIRIHKNTLSRLGNPNRVQLLFNPEKRELLISCPTRSIPESQDEKVLFDKPSSIGGTCQLYSSELIRRIRTVCPDLEEHALYSIHGKYIPSMNAALFRLDEYTRNGKAGESKDE